MPTPPYIACRVSDTLPDEIAVLNDHLQRGSKTSQAKLAGRLITDASCDIIDAFFGTIVKQMLDETGEAGFREAHEVIEDIKGKTRHYLGWITGFFSNERLAPVVAHYQTLIIKMPSAEGSHAHLCFRISEDLARDAKASLATLRDPATTDLRPGIEVLIRVIDEALQPLLFVPKQRMKFNFVVDKTLNGVISVTMALAYRSFRKLGTQLPPAHFERVADHLEQFFFAK